MLGRGIVVAPGGDVPPAWTDAARIRIDDDVLAAPHAAADELHVLWARRAPVVIELAVPAADLRAPEVDHREPWEVGDRFEFGRERLQFLVWGNNWDLRTGEPRWWWGTKAARLGAQPGGPADVVLPDGTAAFVDGGPRGHVPSGSPVVHRESVERGVLAVARHREPDRDLAPDQRAAVEHASGAARVIAPAGSGKTRVLTERLRHVLADEGWERDAVTAVAFNTRAADEMRARTEGLGAHIRTVNSLGLAVLTGDVGGAGRRPVRVLDEHEVRRILDRLLSGVVRQRLGTDVLAPYLEGLSAIRIGLRPPAEVERDLPDAEGLTELWPRYRAALDDLGAVDFDDQIERAIRRLLTDPVARAAAQLRCRHLLVDEFQDLAPAHVLLLRLLAAPGYDVFGVGDDDQVIYGYAGADPTYLIEFDRWFPAAGSHALEVNYRCPERVVDAARQLLVANARRIPKEIRTPPGAAPGQLDVRLVAPEAMAAEAVAAVRAALGEGRSPAEVAVLSRVNSSLLPVQVALSVAGVPTARPVDRRVLDRTGVRTSLAWLRLGLQPERIARADVLETIRRPSRRISRNVVDMLTKRARTSVADIRRLADRLSGGDVDKLLGYADDITAVATASRRGTPAALAAIRTTVGLGQAMDSLDTSRSEADRSSHGDDLRALEQVAALHPDAGTFATWLADLLSRPPDDGPQVTLATVHRVKGQEWPIVVVFGADEASFPHRLATDVEEERRVFHVAITRAGAGVIAIGDAGAPSPFIAEMRGERPAVTRAPRRSRDTAATGVVTPPEAVAGLVATARAALEGGPVDPALWEALRAWRLDAARRGNVPAFVVLSDADLRGVAQRRPRTIAELRRCRGFGPTKLERYGDELLAVLDAFG